MSELILMVNDRILILVRDLSQTKAIDMRKTQQILVALQYIILVESVAQLQEGVEKSIKTISKTICQDTEANENVTLFDDDIDLFDDDDDDIDLFSEDMTSATQKTGHSPEIFIPEASLNPVLQAKEFIALEMTNEAVNLLSLISDGAAGANSKHTELLLELCLSCNIINGNTIDNKELSMGIAFHDIAMAANTAIFNKDGRLTAEELQILRQHPIEGLKLLKHFDQSETASQTVLEHHERYDGSGYPNQLKADQISDAGKLLGIVDSFHAMISHRAHKKYAKDMLRAVSEINACSDTLYDPRWVSTFNTCLRQYWLPMHNKLALR
jgi:HD-GYP domain-containing protein (c-di-GMP phosphodiesterase class II)